MKKMSLVMALLAGFSVFPVSAQEVVCAYSPLQNLIRTVKSADEIVALMNQGVSFNQPVNCGGSLMQLAILRGNPQVLQVLLQKDPSQANQMVSLDSFQIPGAPQEIPLILFAAYYSPNADMFRHLVNIGKADISVTDASGRNLLWYMDQNPVLRSTDLYDTLNKQLLYGLASRTRPTFQLAGQAQPQEGAEQEQQAQLPSAVPSTGAPASLPTTLPSVPAQKAVIPQKPSSSVLDPID